MIRTIVLAGVAAVFALSMLASSAPAGDVEEPDVRPVRIVCIGDSITQGRRGGGEHAMTFSYRYPLWKMMVDAQAKVDFVGSLRGGFNGDADWQPYQGQEFDRDHEGHWGWRTQGIRERLEGWLEGYTPDIALILLGSNDRRGIDSGEKTIADTADEMRRIIEILRADNPNVRVLIGHVFHAWDPFPEMNRAFAALAEEMTTEESSVSVVNHSEGWISHPERAGTHTVDWVHPNRRGDLFLAINWFEAIQDDLVNAGVLAEEKARESLESARKRLEEMD